MTPVEVLLPEPAVGKYTGTNNHYCDPRQPISPKSGNRTTARQKKPAGARAGILSSWRADRLPILARDAE